MPFFASGVGGGRPTKELYSIVGALVLQQMHDLSDEQTVPRGFQSGCLKYVTELMTQST